MVEPKDCRFGQQALQSGLIDAENLAKCWDSLPPEKRTPDAVDRRLARRAIELGYLTVWQAQQLLQGRSAGFRIDKYVLLEHIGHGGMGRVYLAKDTRLNRRVALKVLSRERMNNPRAVARFQREAKVGAQLQHENLVRIYDEGSSNGVYYLVMEYIEGRTAGHLLADRGRIPPAIAADIARQVALGLEHANQKGLIHRDVNPWNILISREGISKLTDMGLAIDLEDDEIVTRDGATVGTFDYISPEQARHSRNVDTRSDIYSLGCSLYHMISGRVPFPQPSLPEKLFAHHSSEAEPLSAAVDDLPEGLEAAVRRMMRKTPEERYATPGLVAEVLAPFSCERMTLAKIEMSSPRVVVSKGVEVGSKPIEAVEAVEPVEPAKPSAGSDADPVEPAVLSRVPEEIVSKPLSPDPFASASAVGSSSSQEPLNPLASLDFGPPPGLAESVSSGRFKKPKSKSSVGPAIEAKPKEKPKPESAEESVPFDQAIPKRWRPATRRTIVRIAGGSAALLAALALGPALFFAFKGRSNPKGRDSSSAVDSRRGSTAKPNANAAPIGAITVRWPDGSQEKFEDLGEALRKSVRDRGEVILAHDDPWHVKLDRPIAVPEGRVVVRAAEGKRPIILIEDAGKTAWLAGNHAGGSLTLSGLTIWARYGDRAATSALIETSGGLSLDRCLFTAKERGRSARAVKYEGTRLDVRGCWFQGFDRALDLVSFPGARLSIRQSMFVWNKFDGRESGWALRWQGLEAPKVEGKRMLVMDRCTLFGLSGGGLLEVAGGGSAESPFHVEIKRTALKTQNLLMWGLAPDKFPKAIRWNGSDNRYDLGGAAWIVLPPNGVANLADSPSDLASWKKVATEDDATKADPLSFANPKPASSRTIEPSDFSLSGDGNQSIGADPNSVGAGSKAIKD